MRAAPLLKNSGKPWLSLRFFLKKVYLRSQKVNLSFHTYSIPTRGSIEIVPKSKLAII